MNEQNRWVSAIRKACLTNRDMIPVYHPGAFKNGKWTCCRTPASQGQASTVDCTRKWIGNTVQNISSSTVRSRDKIARAALVYILSIYGYSSVLSPEVDESTIQLPSLLLVVGAVSLPLKCEYFL